MSSPKFRPLRFGVTRVTLKDGVPGTHYLKADQDLTAYPEWWWLSSHSQTDWRGAHDRHDAHRSRLQRC